MPIVQRITPCLWFDDQAEAAVALYTDVFPRSKVLKISRYSEVGREHHGKEPGSVMTVEFQLDGQRFTALNGGPIFRFSEAISLQVACESEAEVDHYWSRLSDGGDPAAQQCGWLKDRYGVSWQVVPTAFGEMMSDPDPAKVRRVAQAMFGMRKLDLGVLRRAYAGER